MDSISFRNKSGQTFGISEGIAFVTKAGVEMGGDVSAEALKRADAEGFACQALHVVKLHENAGRSVTLVKKNGIRPTDVSTVRVDTDDETVQREFVAAVVGSMRPTKETRTSSLGSDLTGPLIGAVCVGIVGWVVIAMAAEMANGTYQPTEERRGKARLIAKLGGALAERLGLTGSIVVFGILMLLCIAWGIHAAREKHMVSRWRVV